jgi:type I restriction enzyme S subunit
MSELPQGWEWKKLGEVGMWGSGGTPKSNETTFYDGSVPWIRSGDLPDTFITKHQKTITELGIQNSSAKWVPENAVLIAIYGATIGKLGITTYPVTTNQAVAFCQPNQSLVTPVYLFLYLLQAREQLISLGQGGAQPNISQAILKQFPIPLPPLEEQRRIVAKLDVLLGRNKVGRQELTAATQLIKRQRQAVLAQAFSGKLTADVVVSATASDFLSLIPPTKSTLKKKTANLIENTITPPFDIPSNWQWTNIGSVFEVVIGGTPSRQKPEFWDGDIPWVSSGEVAFTRIKNTRQSITQEGIINSSAKLLPIGTVLLGMIGEGKTRGQAAILDIPATSNQNIAAILCSQTPIPSEWLYYWLQASYSVTRGDGVGGVQPALNSDRVRQLLIPIAPLEEQREIVRRIEAAFARIDEGEQAIKQAFTLAERLEQATLAKAFRGEL